MSEVSDRDSMAEQGVQKAANGDRAGKTAGGLSVEQEKALACLIKGEPIKAAAQAAGGQPGDGLPLG